MTDLSRADQIAQVETRLQIALRRPVPDDLEVDFYRSLAATLRADREAAPASLEWQPIETAPKDGTRLLLGDEFDLVTGYWLDLEPGGEWVIGGICPEEPTHWMPLPQPPGAARPGVASAPLDESLSIAESVSLLKQAIERADTPDGPHPFLFDTLSLKDAKRILGAWAAAGLVDGPRGYVLPSEECEREV